MLGGDTHDRCYDIGSGESFSIEETEYSRTICEQNVFIIDDGGDSVRGELERRKFTAEEGDHLTALNVYNAFVKCKSLCSPRFPSLTIDQQTVDSRQNGVTIID